MLSTLNKSDENPNEVLLDPQASAELAGLEYVHDSNEGIRRIKKGKGFVYLMPNSMKVTNEKELQRIKSLVIPPGWSNVWITLNPKGHIQAVGRDIRGRKQYRYHPKWRAFRSQNNFNRMLLFSQKLPIINERIGKDLRMHGLNKEKVLATVIKLMELTYIRIGNEEYEKNNKTFGITTFKDKHAKIKGQKIIFEFKGKSGVEHEIEVSNPRLA